MTYEEGEPETLLEPVDPEHYEFVKRVAAEYGFPLSDWKPTIPSVRERLRRAGLLTFCRERLEERNGHWCSEPAEFILWGKLLDPGALGPRCYDHAAEHVGHSALGDPSWAIADLRPLLRLFGETR